MGKKSKSGLGSLIFKIVKIAVFIFLLANFCWNGKPLWKNIIPTAGSTIEKSEKTLKKEAEKTAKKAIDETKKAAEEAKDSIKDKASGAADITEEEEKEIEKIIKKNLNQ